MYATQTLWGKAVLYRRYTCTLAKVNSAWLSGGQRGGVHAQNVKEKGAQARTPAASVSHILEIWS